MVRSRPALTALLLVLAAALRCQVVRAEDAASSFSATSNPNGRWTYGSASGRGGAFILFNVHAPDAAGLDVWKRNGYPTQVAHNGTAIGKLVGGTVYTPVGGLNLTPGDTYEWSVVRWTAPATGTYAINAHFVPRALSNAGGGASEVALLANGAVVFDRWLAFPLGLNTASVAVTLALTAGQFVDFTVGNADDGNNLDVIGLDATVDLVLPDPGPMGPVFVLAGQRFAACKWGSASESIAFDPIRRQLASRGFIRDLCGNQISTGPDEQPGLAWDSKTGTYWQVLNNRTVRRWSAAGALLDTVFTVPLTFTVPTTGLDTLESVRGIATDSSYVYMVDAGPVPGTAPSSEWFKFTRTGTPVKSSKSTNFSASLGPDPDALADDICYVPFSSPVLGGRLVVALEHTGLQVIDTDGNNVSAFRWATQGFTTRPLAALAGVAVDPASGNFYLADNDKTAALVLTRIPGQGAASYTVGGIDGSGGLGALSADLKNPTPGCDLPLWSVWGVPASAGGNLFGWAYRSLDRSVYLLDYGSNGELWRFDPRMGAGARVGPTGISGSWSLAYDSERDVLYGAVGYPLSRIVTIDPSNGATFSLQNPSGLLFGSSTGMTWNSVDKKLYVVDASVNPHRLLKIDRDTGAAVIVANTTAGNGGLAFDAASGKLQALDGATGNLVSIDPATGASTALNTLQRKQGYEGLALIPVPAVATVSVADAPALGASGMTVVPNPTRGDTGLLFALAAPQAVTLDIYDVAGRRVRKVAARAYEAGAHRVTWDGRRDDGSLSSSGVYFARLELGAETRVARIVISR